MSSNIPPHPSQQRKPFTSLTHSLHTNRSTAITIKSTSSLNANVKSNALKSQSVTSTSSSSGRTTPTLTSTTSSASSSLKKKSISSSTSTSSATSSISSLIAQDKAARLKAKQLQRATRLPTNELHASSSSLSQVLSRKTLSDPVWAAKQESFFIQWINHQITTHTSAALEDVHVAEVMYARFRTTALQIVNSVSFITTLAKVDSEIDAGRITLKQSSSKLAENYLNRRELREMLTQNLTSFWLRLACETLSGYEVPKPRTKELIEKFMEEWIFASKENEIIPYSAAEESHQNLAASFSSSSSASSHQLPSLDGMDIDHRHRIETASFQSRARETLKKVFRLFLFVDAAKVENVGAGLNASVGRGTSRFAPQPQQQTSSNNGPILFRTTSTLHSTTDLLTHFSARFLNEGNFIRHLHFLGYRLTFVEKLEDQIDFRVKNLAVDLRDGVRLGKLVEVCWNREAAKQLPSVAVNLNQTQSFLSSSMRRSGLSSSAAQATTLDLISQMRLPADSDVKKLYNLNLCLQVLREADSSSSSAATTSPYQHRLFSTITAEDLHGGSQLQTYNFLWSLISKYDVQSLIRVEEIEEEIQRIKQQHLKFASTLHPSLSQQQVNLYFGGSEKIQTLLSWVQTVVWGGSMQMLRVMREHKSASQQHPSQLQIENFTTSFRSGVALCLIINYYYPSLIKKEEIQYPKEVKDKMVWEVDEKKSEENIVNTESKEEQEESEKENKGWSCSFSNASVFRLDSLEDHHDYRAARFNYSLVLAAMQELGEVAEYSSSSESSNPLSHLFNQSGDPHEHQMITFLSRICARLLILSKEIHAVRMMQRISRQWLIKLREKRTEAEREEEEKRQQKIRKQTSDALMKKQQAADEATRAQAKLNALEEKRQAKRQSQEEEYATLMKEQQQAQEVMRKRKLEQQQREWEERERAEREEEEAEQAELRAQQQREQEELERIEAEKQAAEQARVQRINDLSNASTTLTSIRRGVVARRVANHMRYELAIKKEQCATKLQCAWRSRTARGLLTQLKLERDERIRIAYQAHLNHSASIIQSTYRMYHALQVLKKMNALAEERRRQGAAVKIQTAARGWSARLLKLRLISQQHILHQQRTTAATLLQSLYRRYTHRNLLREMKSQRAIETEAVIMIQSHVRAFKAREVVKVMKEERRREQERQFFIKQQATRVQSVWRGHVARVNYSIMRKQTISATIMLQKHYRSHIARRELSVLKEQHRLAVEKFQREQNAVSTMANWYRCITARRVLSSLRAEYHQKQVCNAIRIQSVYRSFLARRELAQLKQEESERRARVFAQLQNDCAVKIQCVFKQHIAKKVLSMLRAQYIQKINTEYRSAVMIQSLVRARKARVFTNQLRAERHFLMQNRAAVKMQSIVRMYHARLQVQQLRMERLEKMQNYAAIKMQSIVRMYHARIQVQQLRADRLFQKQTFAATKVQSVFKMHQARQQLRQLRYEEAVRQHEIKIHSAAVMIQSYLRRYFAQKMLSQLKIARQQLMNEKATSIQTFIRAYFARRMLEQLREEKAKREYEEWMMKNQCALIIQCAVRRYQAKRILSSLRLRHHSAIILQCLIRRFLARRYHSRLVQARLDAIARERARVAAHRAKLEAMQAEIRALEVRAAILATQRAEEREALVKRAVISMQARYRGKVARSQYAQLKVEQADRLEQHRLLTLRISQLRSRIFVRKIKTIQTAWRRIMKSPVYKEKKMAKFHQAAKKIQCVVRGFLARLYASKRKQAILTLQRIYRGRKVCAKLNKVLRLKLVKIQKNLRSAQKNVTDSQRVGNRTKSALEILLSSTNLSTVLHATQTLDRTTSLLRVCCHEAVTQNAVPALLEVTRSLNRSKPHLLLLESTLNILINLAREPTTRKFVFTSSSAGNVNVCDTLIDGLVSYTTSASILLKLCEILKIGLKAAAATSTSTASSSSSSSSSSSASPSFTSLRDTVRASSTNMKKLQGVQSLLERKLVVETKSAASSSSRMIPAVKRVPSGASSSAASSSAPKKSVNFDQFECACHGTISSAVVTSSEKIVNLTACCEHLRELTQLLA